MLSVKIKPLCWVSFTELVVLNVTMKPIMLGVIAQNVIMPSVTIRPNMVGVITQNVTMLSFTSLCRMSLHWVSQLSPLCWVSLRRMSLCWVSKLRYYAWCLYAEHCYTVRHMLGVITRNVIRLSVVAPAEKCITHFKGFWTGKKPVSLHL